MKTEHGPTISLELYPLYILAPDRLILCPALAPAWRVACAGPSPLPPSVLNGQRFKSHPSPSACSYLETNSEDRPASLHGDGGGADKARRVAVAVAGGDGDGRAAREMRRGMGGRGVGRGENRRRRGGAYDALKI